MHVVFDERFHQVYSCDPAAEKGRLGPTARRLRAAGFPFVRPDTVSDADLLRVHTAAHLADVGRDQRVDAMARLAAGGALAAGRLALAGQPAFALVRPPGHHASPDSCWGFCFFNNVAVCLAALLAEGVLDSALVLDIDLHFGDGSDNIFERRREVTYLHPEGHGEADWLQACKRQLDRAERAGVLAVSAGFDRHREDWGGQLSTAAYAQVGRWVREAAGRLAAGHRFVVLEGGYNPDSMAEAALALASALD